MPDVFERIECYGFECEACGIATCVDYVELKAEYKRMEAEIERMRAFMNKRTFDGENTELEIYEWLEGDA